MEKTLYQAIIRGKTSEALSLLKERNVQEWINKPAETETCLYAACSTSNSKVIKKILKIPGIDVNKGTFLHSTPLPVSTRNNRLDIVKLLVERGAECKGDNVNVSPLHIASYNDFTEILEFLLEKFKDGINDKTTLTHGTISIVLPCSSTPLHVASTAGKLRSAKLLVKYGADLTIKAEGKTPYDLAVKYERWDLASFLKAHECTAISHTLILRMTKLEVKYQHLEESNSNLQSQCNNLKTENSDLKLRMSKIEKKGKDSKKNVSKKTGKLKAENIRRNFKYLTDNLYAEDHIDYLYQEKAISLEDYQVVRKKDADVEKSREMLIRLLGKKTNEWVDVFDKSLQLHSKHIVCQLINGK